MEALAVHVEKAVGEVEEVEHVRHRFRGCPEQRAVAEVGGGDIGKGDRVDLRTLAGVEDKGFQFLPGGNAPAAAFCPCVINRLVQPEIARRAGTGLCAGVSFHADRASFPGQPMFPARRLVALQGEAGAIRRDAGCVRADGKKEGQKEGRQDTGSHAVFHDLILDGAMNAVQLR